MPTNEQPDFDEEFAQADKKDHMHHVLNCERINEVPRRMIEDKHRGSTGESGGQEPDEQKADDSGKDNRGRTSRLLPKIAQPGCDGRGDGAGQHRVRQV